MSEIANGPPLKKGLENPRYQRFLKEKATPEFSNKLTAYGRLLLNTANGLFKSNFPLWKPQERTRLLLTLPPDGKILVKTFIDKDPHSIREEASYYGKVNGDHLVYLSAFLSFNDINKALTSNMPIISHLLNVIHEMGHQKHAEISGQEKFGTAALEQYFAGKDIMVLTPDDIRHAAELVFVGEPQNIGLAVKEGFAILIEMNMIEKMMHIEPYRGNEFLLSQVKKRRNVLIEIMKKDIVNAHGQMSSQRSPHGAGMYGIARSLFIKLGVEGALDHMKKVDLASCSKIQYPNPEYERLLADPFSLPLEK